MYFRVQMDSEEKERRNRTIKSTIQKICNESLLLKVFEWFPRSIISTKADTWNACTRKNCCSKYSTMQKYRITYTIYANGWKMWTNIEPPILRHVYTHTHTPATNKYFAFDYSLVEYSKLKIFLTLAWSVLFFKYHFTENMSFSGPKLLILNLQKKNEIAYTSSSFCFQSAKMCIFSFFFSLQ